ncbi:MAG TPA: NAD(+) diphosphatase [Longimicrobium sp.]|nr:NAD(+) diphosphatase [Longimicrobium sp.]
MSGSEPSPILCFAFRGNDILVSEDEGRGRVPSIDRILVDEDAWLEVGELGGMRCVAVGVRAEVPAPRGCAWMPLRASFRVLTADEFRMAGRASEIVEWERAHRFCGRCGGRTAASGEVMARRCTECGSLHYPRLSPAVLVSVVRGDRILLARSPHFPPGMFSTVAGFVDPGESLEETVTREVREEVGIEVGTVRYFGSQPWPFPSSLMVAFTAEYAGGELAPDPAEIEEAGWYAVDEIPIVPPAISLARALIDDFVRARGGDPSTLRTSS